MLTLYLPASSSLRRKYHVMDNGYLVQPNSMPNHPLSARIFVPQPFRFYSVPPYVTVSKLISRIRCLEIKFGIVFTEFMFLFR